jgi:putative peptidoglycan lipid II flippase
MVLSYFFGASAVADAFFVAFRIPNFFRRLFAEGAFSQAFVPVLAGYRAANNRPALLDFVSVMTGNFAGLLFLVSLTGVLAAPLLVTVFAPGFWQQPDKLALTTELLRITFPYLGFISLTAFAGALLNAHDRFAVAAFTPVLLNLSLIGAALFATSLFEEPVVALAWGVFVAGLAQLLFQLPFLARLNLLVRPRIDRHHPGVRRVGALVIPAVFAASVSQINALIDTLLASLLITGSISWLYYADRLLELPIGLVAVTIATVLLPNLSRLHARAAAEGFARTLDWGLRVSLLFAVPAAVALYVLAVPVIATIFYRGALTALDVNMTALAVQAFAVGMIGFTLVKVLAPAYFARQDTRTPVRFAVVAVLVNLLLNLALFRVMGHVGLALATSTAAVVQSWLLLRGLIRRGHYQPDAAFLWFLGKIALAAAVMVVPLIYVPPAEQSWLAMSSLMRAAWLGGICLAGGGLYFIVLILLGVRPAQMRYRV